MDTEYSSSDGESLNIGDSSWIDELFECKYFKPEAFNDQGIKTSTSKEQKKVEESIKKIFKIFIKKAELDPEEPILEKEKHIKYLTDSLSILPAYYECLNASRPWLCYWILHSLALLRHPLKKEQYLNVAQFLGRCQNEDGGFGGGPGQLSHLAPTYAAVNAICTIGLPEAYNIINRETLRNFLWSVKQDDGSFVMHKGGEMDVRSIYCAASVSRLTNLYSDSLFKDSAEWIVSCQTYEGGFAGLPGMEAHGGYAFCAIAALSLLRKEHLCDISSLLRWTANRQMKFEGGFQGRTNKLVDGCYSFWQGGSFPIIQRILTMEGEGNVEENDRWLFNSNSLQQYILVCCQCHSGGLIDKPMKPRDIYHTCYTLSGLSVAQNQPVNTNVLGSTNNLLEPVHPLYNIVLDKAKLAGSHFMQIPVPLDLNEDCT